MLWLSRAGYALVRCAGYALVRCAGSALVRCAGYALAGWIYECVEVSGHSDAISNCLIRDDQCSSFQFILTLSSFSTAAFSSCLWTRRCVGWTGWGSRRRGGGASAHPNHFWTGSSYFFLTSLLDVLDLAEGREVLVLIPSLLPGVVGEEGEQEMVREEGRGAGPLPECCFSNRCSSRTGLKGAGPPF